MPILNRALSLDDLPPAPSDRKGWPWTEQSKLLPERMPDGSEWPRISIVTPSYNQGQFIEETIRSVLLQGYPNLEYIIIDGGSTDESVQVIKKYEQFLAYWVSEEDKGQSHAINKGTSLATGDIFCWINSDDYFLRNTLKTISLSFISQGIGLPLWIVGKGAEKHEASGEMTYPHFKVNEIRREDLAWSNFISQPSVFWSRKLNMPLQESLNYVLDWELWNRFIQISNPVITHDILSVSRIHPDTKTSTGKYKIADELYSVALQYGQSKPLAFIYRYGLWESKHIEKHSNGVLTILFFKALNYWLRWIIIIIFGSAALKKYSWDFCA